MSDHPNLDSQRGRGDILLSTASRQFTLPYVRKTEVKICVSALYVCAGVRFCRSF